MKNFLIPFFLTCLIASVSCDGDIASTAPEKVTLSRSEFEIRVGNKDTLVAAIAPTNTANKVMKWSSSDPGIATVTVKQISFISEIAEITAKSEGQVVITVKAEDGYKKGISNLTVLPPVLVGTLKLDRTALSLGKGDFARLTVTVVPEYAYDKSLSWSSSDPSVATIDPESGVMEAISKGTATITVTANDASKTTASCKLTVVDDIIPLVYCNVDGTGDYNLSKLSTTGVTENITYEGGTPPGGYEHISEKKLVLDKGQTITLNVTQSNNWTRTVVWIDWNRDGNFSNADEQYTLGIKKKDGEEADTSPERKESITVPQNAVPGISRMRVQTVDGWSDENACGTDLKYRSTKDFDVFVR